MADLFGINEEQKQDPKPDEEKEKTLAHSAAVDNLAVADEASPQLGAKQELSEKLEPKQFEGDQPANEGEEKPLSARSKESSEYVPKEE